MASHRELPLTKPGLGVLDGQVIGLVVFEIDDGKVIAVRAMLNPEKLGHLADV